MRISSRPLDLFFIDSVEWNTYFSAPDRIQSYDDALIIEWRNTANNEPMQPLRLWIQQSCCGDKLQVLLTLLEFRNGRWQYKDYVQLTEDIDFNQFGERVLYLKLAYEGPLLKDSCKKGPLICGDCIDSDIPLAWGTSEDNYIPYEWRSELTSFRARLNLYWTNAVNRTGDITDFALFKEVTINYDEPDTEAVTFCVPSATCAPGQSGWFLILTNPFTQGEIRIKLSDPLGIPFEGSELVESIFQLAYDTLLIRIVNFFSDWAGKQVRTEQQGRIIRWVLEETGEFFSGFVLFCPETVPDPCEDRDPGWYVTFVSPVWLKGVAFKISDPLNIPGEGSELTEELASIAVEEAASRIFGWLPGLIGSLITLNPVTGILVYATIAGLDEAIELEAFFCPGDPVPPPPPLDEWPNPVLVTRITPWEQFPVGDPMRYDCVNGVCQQVASGPYASYAACQQYLRPSGLTGGQCQTLYKVEIITNYSFNGVLQPPQIRVFDNQAGPITGYKTEILPCNIGTQRNTEFFNRNGPGGTPQKISIVADLGCVSPTGALKDEGSTIRVTRNDQQPDNCGNPPGNCPGENGCARWVIGIRMVPIVALVTILFDYERTFIVESGSPGNSPPTLFRNEDAGYIGLVWPDGTVAEPLFTGVTSGPVIAGNPLTSAVLTGSGAFQYYPVIVSARKLCE